MQLRPYQSRSRDAVYEAWRRVPNALLVMPTGAGKTVVLSEIIKDFGGPTCAVAHRQELVVQMSLALARDEVRHRIVGPLSVVKLAMRVHADETGRSWIDPNGKVAVAGVDTLIRRKDALARWRETVGLWVIDEAHHVAKPNKWFSAVEMFPNARGLGVTATPERADGMGLGRHADGVFDEMIVGPSMRRLIEDGYLTEYRIFAPPSDLVLSDVPIGKSGDYSPDRLNRAVMKSHVVGDVVDHYLRLARGRLGVTFATTVEAATAIAHRFVAEGVPAEVVSAKTPDAERIRVLRDFRSRKVTQLVNVDLFGEGFDLPAIEVVSMARPTQSYALYAQQFGRSLRLMEGKTEALVIDHVGNVLRHGLPDAAREWSLDRRERRSRGGNDGAEAVTSCGECAAVYERRFRECPFCGHRSVPSERSGPEHVDGDLCELDAATLARMRGEIERVDLEPRMVAAELAAKGAPLIGQKAHVKRHVERQEAQKALRAALSWWGGVQRNLGRPDSESYRLFYLTYGADVLTVQTYRPKKAYELANRINRDLAQLSYE